MLLNAVYKFMSPKLHRETNVSKIVALLGTMLLSLVHPTNLKLLQERMVMWGPREEMLRSSNKEKAQKGPRRLTHFNYTHEPKQEHLGSIIFTTCFQIMKSTNINFALNIQVTMTK